MRLMLLRSAFWARLLSFWRAQSALFEPLLGHVIGRVDAHHSEAGVPRVDEAVRRVRRHDHDLARMALNRLVADPESGRPIQHDEGLLVGVAMKLRPLARRVEVDEEGRGRAVVAALEAARPLAPWEVGELKRCAHAVRRYRC